MRTGRPLAIALAALLALGLCSSVALAGKKKKTAVVLNSGPVLSGKTNVKVSGFLNTTAGCKSYRAMKLFLTDASGTVLATLDGSTADVNGNWKLQGKLSAPPTASQRLQVKASKRTVNKAVCRAGFSPLIAIS